MTRLEPRRKKPRGLYVKRSDHGRTECERARSAYEIQRTRDDVRALIGQPDDDVRRNVERDDPLNMYALPACVRETFGAPRVVSTTKTRPLLYSKVVRLTR